MFATIRTQLLENPLDISRPIHLNSAMPLLLTENHNENCRFQIHKERKRRGEKCCLVSKQQLTPSAARAAGWVPEFPCFCLRLHILFLRNLTRLTSLNMSGFTLPSDTQSQHTVIKNLYESKSYSLFISKVALVTKPGVL